MRKQNPPSAAAGRQQQAQLRVTRSALREVLCAAFGAPRRPADRALSGYFREHRQCGSRDRQFISEAVFAALRNWGVLRRLLPEPRREAIENGASGPTARELEILLAGALRLEPPVPPAEYGDRPTPAETADARARALLRDAGVEAPPVAQLRLPDWVAGRVDADFPLDAFRAALLLRPPMWLRAQTPEIDSLAARLGHAGLAVERHALAPGALAVRNARVNLFTLEDYRSGAFEVQDLASQAIGLVAAPKPGERWFDCCAGAGGKTLQLADLMQRRGTVVASDIRAYKLEDLRKRARRAGFPNILTRPWDGREFHGRKQASFDGVLVDAPCSCSGVWRRNPDGCWTLRPEEVAETALLQRRILAAAATAVRPGGVLIYATCSIFPEENRQTVEHFLAGHPEFSREAFVHPLTGAPVPGGMLQIGPADGDCDAMFVARMRRAAAPEPAAGTKEPENAE